MSKDLYQFDPEKIKDSLTNETIDVVESDGEFEGLTFFATCPKGIEHLLRKEIEASYDQVKVKESVAGVFFTSSLSIAYQFCLNSRFANRAMLLLAQDRVGDAETLVDVVSAIDWETYISPEQTLWVDFNGSNNGIRDSRFGAKVVKDGLQRRFFGRTLDAELERGEQARLTIEAESPDIIVYARLFKDKFLVGLDLVGESLHKRGYRIDGAAAPLKENLAAAIVNLSGWSDICDSADESGKQPLFIDPMCGSGTLLIEAAQRFLKVPPAIQRSDWMLSRLRNYDQRSWQQALALAESRAEDLSALKALLNSPIFIGYDRDAETVDIAQANISAAGLDGIVSVEQANLSDLADNFVSIAKARMITPELSLLLTNPPYGKRIGELDKLGELYQQLGAAMKNVAVGWQMAIFTGNPDLGWSTGLRSFKQYKLSNGAIPCQLQRYKIDPQAFTEGVDPGDLRLTVEQLSESEQMLANRIKKNVRKLKPWLKQHEQCCFRAYDADIPEYAVAIDCYYVIPISSESEQKPHLKLYMQEYKAPASVSQSAAAKRLREAKRAAAAVFGITLSNVIVKQREKQKGSSQYQRLGQGSENYYVREKGFKFKVNLFDYLDTGIFIDHRKVRAEIMQYAKGKRFLNLFAYTASATVYAAKGGARDSVSVDMSQTYIDWATDNFAANDLSIWQHKLVKADCVAWLQEESDKRAHSFDCILLDPPSFSNSKKMTLSLDIQRDHAGLIDDAMNLLKPDGRLYFSNNRRGFKLDKSVTQKYRVREITRHTVDADFNVQKPPHRCWTIEHLPSSQVA